MTDLNKRYDALVIGSGATGSIAVKELTERGLEVLLLEAGRDITEADFVPQPAPLPQPMSIDLGPRIRATLKGQHRQSRRAMFQASKNPFLVNDLEAPYSTKGGDFLWIRGRQLGGRLHSYGRVLLRNSDHTFKAATQDGQGEDWPISYADIAPYYDRVEEFIGVYGTEEKLENLPDGKYRGPSQLNTAEKHFKSVVENKWPERHVIPWRFAAPNLERVPVGIVAARATGRLTTRTDAVVTKINVDRKTGRADGATFVDRHTKQEHTVHADVVMLCASTIESVRLLLNSATDGHPNGLGNSSGTLGQYFMDQTPSLMFADDPQHTGFERIDIDIPDPYYGPVGGVYIPRFENVSGITNPSFARGWSVQGVIGRLPVPETHAGTAGLMGFGEMLPRRDNSISLHRRRKDRYGVPIPVIRLKTTENEHNLMRAQVAGLREMAEAAGYKVNFAGSALGLDSSKVWQDADPVRRTVFRLAFKKSMAMGAAIHECGGARMGSDPKTSVLNEHNQVWDVPNVFVTDSSCYVTNGGVGPTLTIMALTARAAEYIANERP
jgi:choline dehydrogenase-like flavoprotein